MQTQFQATTSTHVILNFKNRKHHELLISIHKKKQTVIYSSVKSVLLSIPTANFIEWISINDRINKNKKYNTPAAEAQ
jgi:hypothetical protein